MSNSRYISTEEIEKLSFGKEKITLEIPKFTKALIVTTISCGKLGTQNISTNSYTDGEIQKIKLKEYCDNCGVELDNTNKALDGICNDCKYGLE